MGAIASQITSLPIVYSTLYSDADQRKHQSSAWLAFVWGIHRGSVNSPHKWSVTRKMFPFDDVIMMNQFSARIYATLSFNDLTIQVQISHVYETWASPYPCLQMPLHLTITGPTIKISMGLSKIIWMLRVKDFICTFFGSDSKSRNTSSVSDLWQWFMVKWYSVSA